MAHVPILCYHKVGPVEEEGRWLNIEPRTLASHVRFFGRRGYTFLRGGDLARPWPARAVLFTFDDAYVSAVAHVPQVFEPHRAVATFYAVPSCVGESSRWDGERAGPLAGWQELRALQAAGYEIGNHTDTHPRLGNMSAEEQAAEISRADATLRAEGLAPASFCYPYGSLSDESRSALERSGYRVGLAIGKRAANEGDPLHALPRIVVACGDRLPMLLYKIHIRPKLP